MISTVKAETDHPAKIHAWLNEKIKEEHRPANYLLVDSSNQTMQFCESGHTLNHFRISTAANGLGGESDSYKTPPGLLQISDKIGAGAVIGMLFTSRLAQPMCATIETRPLSTGIDTITSRILRLDGLEEGVNKGGHCDAYKRYIYIHGTAEEGLLGQPVSHGCIRMSNEDVIDLFAVVKERTLVFIF